MDEGFDLDITIESTRIVRGVPELPRQLLKMPVEVRERIMFELQSIQVIGYVLIYMQQKADCIPIPEDSRKTFVA